jgi:Tfp pilus assembly protein PilZ
MKPAPEQRRHPRHVSFIIAKYTVIEGTFRDVIRNISAGGLIVKTHRKVAVGQPITIEFPLFQFDKIIQVLGRVVRRDPVGFAITFNEPIHGLICEEGQFPKIVREGNRSNKMISWQTGSQEHSYVRQIRWIQKSGRFA